MKHPTVALTDLSVDAQTLYGSARKTLKLDRDWLKPGTSQADPTFTPSAAILAAVDELVDAGYAWNSSGNVYGLRSVDPQLYTVATGNGPWRIEVARVLRPGLREHHEGTLLAVLDGAELETESMQGAVSAITLSVAIPGAHDSVHDPAYAAMITVQLPTFPRFNGREMIFWGIAETVHLYPIGTDPRLVEDRTFRALSAPVPCTDKHCRSGHKGRRPHVIAPELPPAVDLQRSVLCIEATIR